MSTTQTATEQRNTSTPPEITILARVASIPIIASSLETIDGALSSNTYTRSPYITAKDISHSAYKYSESLQTRLAPFIVQADGYANKAVDAVESRYPYPFKAKPEEVANLMRERKQVATDYVTNSVNIANKKIDENIKTPALNVAQGIDQRFCPIVDYFEVAVTRLNNSEAGPSNPPDAKYQYQRAFALSKALKDNVYVYSNEQFKNLQTQNALVHRATETAQSITTLTSSSILSAQAHIHKLSDNMLVELQKLQTSTASFSASVQSSLHNSTSHIQEQIQPQIQWTYSELTTNFSEVVSELRSVIATKDMSVQEKVTRVGHQVHDHIGPLLETIRRGVSELLTVGKERASQPNACANSANDAQPQNGNLD